MGLLEAQGDFSTIRGESRSAISTRRKVLGSPLGAAVGTNLHCDSVGGAGYRFWMRSGEEFRVCVSCRLLPEDDPRVSLRVTRQRQSSNDLILMLTRCKVTLYKR